MQLKKSEQFKNFFSKLTALFKKHYGAFLFLLFIASMLFWGWIFWKYGYQVVFGEPDIKIRMINIKKSGLESIMKDLEQRSEVTQLIQGKSFSNPFIERSEEVIVPGSATSTLPATTSEEVFPALDL